MEGQDKPANPSKLGYPPTWQVFLQMAKLEMQLQAVLAHLIPESQDTLNLAQEVLDAVLWTYHEKKNKLKRGMFSLHHHLSFSCIFKVTFQSTTQVCAGWYVLPLLMANALTVMLMSCVTISSHSAQSSKRSSSPLQEGYIISSHRALQCERCYELR
jgi:hypothetical protein